MAKRPLQQPKGEASLAASLSKVAISTRASARLHKASPTLEKSKKLVKKAVEKSKQLRTKVSPRLLRTLRPRKVADKPSSSSTPGDGASSTAAKTGDPVAPEKPALGPTEKNGGSKKESPRKATPSEPTEQTKAEEPKPSEPLVFARKSRPVFFDEINPSVQPELALPGSKGQDIQERPDNDETRPADVNVAGERHGDDADVVVENGAVDVAADKEEAKGSPTCQQSSNDNDENINSTAIDPDDSINKLAPPAVGENDDKSVPSKKVGGSDSQVAAAESGDSLMGDSVGAANKPTDAVSESCGGVAVTAAVAETSPPPKQSKSNLDETIKSLAATRSQLFDTLLSEPAKKPKPAASLREPSPSPAPEMSAPAVPVSFPPVAPVAVDFSPLTVNTEIENTVQPMFSPDDDDDFSSQGRLGLMLT